MPNKRLLTFMAVTFLAAIACGLPTEQIDTVGTAAAETIAAGVGANPVLPEATDIPPAAPTTDTSTIPTNAPPPTNPPPPTNTPTQESICDLAGFITDVTIPDGTNMTPGQTFTKTWRLVNNGSCTWTSGYQLVFYGGDQMGGPSSKQLTSGTVAPGQTIDISVNLTAPTSAGTYKGDWKLKNPSGQVFALNGGIPFYVEIKVVTASPTPTTSSSTTHTVTRNQVQQGAVTSTGVVIAYPNTGDAENNSGYEAFARFNISSIPSNATITKIEVDFSDYDTLGDPFGSLGCLRSYYGNFFPLGAGDYISGSQTGALTRWCNEGELSAVSVASNYFVSTLQSAVGDTYFEIIIRFNTTETDSDGVADMVRFGTMSLKITYTTP